MPAPTYKQLTVLYFEARQQLFVLEGPVSAATRQDIVQLWRDCNAWLIEKGEDPISDERLHRCLSVERHGIEST